MNKVSELQLDRRRRQWRTDGRRWRRRLIRAFRKRLSAGYLSLPPFFLPSLSLPSWLVTRVVQSKACMSAPIPPTKLSPALPPPLHRLYWREKWEGGRYRLLPSLRSSSAIAVCAGAPVRASHRSFGREGVCSSPCWIAIPLLPRLELVVCSLGALYRHSKLYAMELVPHCRLPRIPQVMLVSFT